MNEANYAAALSLGLLGGSHCLVMCGGIGAALGAGADPSRRLRWVLLFQLGRISAYTLLGAGLGALLAQLGGGAIALAWLRVLAGLLLVAMGFYLASWWQGVLWLERGGQQLWRFIQPLAQRRLPVRRNADALLVGLAWGFLPCGLIYTALAWSAVSASWQQGAALMFCFGLGTLPLMLATGLAGERLGRALRQRKLRNTAALLLIAFGLWTASLPIAHKLGSAPSEQAHSHH